MNTTSVTHGLETILQRIQHEHYVKYAYGFKENKEDFRIETSLNDKFIPPILSEVQEYSNASLYDARIILIEAVGATGKTELTKNMSYKLQCPIFDLGKTSVVAGHSLTGLLTKRMNRADNFEFSSNVEAGKSTLIIDALDEGYMKTNHQGFMDFLDDVLSLEPQCSCPIIMLGRYNAVELAATLLYLKEIPFITLQIEPFTLQQARDFIDKAIDDKSTLRYQSIYKQTRDYMLSTIGGFLKDQSSIKNKVAERFIGYAPVLLSIAAFFKVNMNYQVVLEELQTANTKSVSLIIDILDRILKRDREEKAFPNLIDGLLIDRDVVFQDDVRKSIYTPIEQCARVLYAVMQRPFPDLTINDPAFLLKYNEHINTWIQEHPFLGKGQIANVVFESYILARLVNEPLYRETALEYMQMRGVSYMFAYIYKELHGMHVLDKKVLPFIYSSLLELNTKSSYYSLNLSCVACADDELECDFEFVGSDEIMENYSGSITYSKSDVLELGAKLEYLNINVPIQFALKARRVAVSSTSYVKCSSLLVNCEEIIIHRSDDNMNFMFECDNMLVMQSYDQYVQITGPGKTASSMTIVCPDKLEYPFYDYWTSESVKLATLSSDNEKKYKKLRAIVLEFRSHSKNELGKHKQKIDFVLGNTDIGKSVIKSLKESGIIYEEGHLYIINSEIMDEVFGLSYDGIRNFDVTQKIIKFLESID